MSELTHAQIMQQKERLLMQQALAGITEITKTFQQGGLPAQEAGDVHTMNTDLGHPSEDDQAAIQEYLKTWN